MRLMLVSCAPSKTKISVERLLATIHDSQHKLNLQHSLCSAARKPASGLLVLRKTPYSN
jgi:hypothetical protein